MSLSVIQRILLGFGVLLVLLLTIAVAGFEGTNKVEDRLNVVTGKVSNIMVNSNKLRDDLALSNATVLQYLLSKSPESLDVLSQRFASLTTQYQEISSNLADDFQNSPMMQDALTKIDQEVDAFMQLTDVAFSNHKRMLELQATIPDEKLDLKDAINFTSEDLSFLQEGGDTSEIQFAASYMVSQAQSLQVTVNDYFDLRDLTSMQSLRDDMVSVIGSLREKQDYLKDDNINGLIDEVDVSVQSDDGVINKYFENTRLTQESEQLAKQLSDSMKLVDESVQLLLTEANQMATVAKEEASSAANLSRLVISVVFVVSIVIAILVALWVSRSIRSPLKEVMRVLGLISEGDFTQRSQVKTKDEFGELSGWVNGLVERLQKVMAEIDQSSTEVAASANSNVHIAGESKRLMGSQNERTTEVASSMSEMASTVEQVAKSSEFILHQIQSADQRAGQNRTQMDANIAKIEALLAQIEESTSVVNQLDEYSKNIDSILDVIQDIAEQTNLLALNAAIEAARAGEQGRGFAVVADEVRTLATRTHSSTEEIQRVIAQLQQGVKKAVGSMEESRQSATSSVGEARSVGESLSELQNNMVEIRDLSTQIATAAEQQSAVAHEISDNVIEISSMSEEAASGADKSAHDSEDLSALASRQKELLSQFKIV
ncbi:methyl-accepting chemotaxis protein [Marinomonas posidonica]|uniref:Methyl-accepting chemotaxis sensory transducer n=1 Tax=Marinomonas posidonica (strain CECT 7376 / NCIMB 14433 / IVIA-Po-181) TaxID=491952 RepID=F6CYB5_MARPP|nr:methyl-accepting chemotaxis protein [Marinomonas posidonica]AEF53442.1 methyl-accepting chemotaxis sensory transducer [Marinomonas posidonica IVIA-Po-181]